jgi:SAM-dependent methyltransferase
VSADPPLSPMATLRWAVVQRILSELAPRRVLEIGCGQGGFGARIAGRAEYLGVEPDRASCQVAAERIQPRGGQVWHGTSDLVDPTDRFDLLCAFEVLEHLPNDKDALRDWTTRLAPGGHILVSVPAWPDRFGPWDEMVGHYRRYSPEQLDDLLSSIGAEDVRPVLYGWPLGYLLELTRNRIAQHRGRCAEEPLTSRSAASGRLFQPKQALGPAVRWGTRPFVAMQRWRPDSGIGLVGVARLTRSPDAA